MSFDKIIKDKLEHYEAPANANAWTEFSTKLNATSQTPFMGPLVGGIAATVALTALFVSLPDLNSNTEHENNPVVIEQSASEDANIKLEENSIVVEHVAQESHPIQLMQIDEEYATPKTGDIKSADETVADGGSVQILEDNIPESNNTIEENMNAESVAINFTANGIQCPKSDITFTAQLEQDAKVTWIFDGVVVKNGLQVKHAFGDAGTYQTRMIAEFNDGSEKALTQTIEVYENPQSEFKYSIQQKDQCFDQGLVLEGAPSSNTYKWVLDGDTIGKGVKLETIVSKSLHTLGMQSVNEFGCTSYTTESIRVDEGLNLVIPTAFSPTRNDGLNDTWKAEALNNVASFNIKIVRLGTGKVVFESSESIEWDGSIPGSSSRIESGEVFTYFITVTDNCGKTKQLTNTIKYI